MNKNLWVVVVLVASFKLCIAQQGYKEDFNYLWNQIQDNYAYFEQQKTDWNAVKDHFEPLTDTVSHPYYFTLFLEQVLLSLHDSHTHLLTNTDKSLRLLPSGTDVHGTIKGNRFIIDQVRSGSNIEGLLLPGDWVLNINGKNVQDVVASLISPFTLINQKTKTHAFNLALAGDYKRTRNITVLRNNQRFELNLGVCEFPKNEPSLLTTNLLENNIGYIRIENSLGNTDLIAEFDAALNTMLDTKALILDLRNTPSGGNSNVGKPLLGRFVDTPTPYQTHFRKNSNERWTEMVSPRGVFYKKPVYVLVNFWTGSMGEGMAVGFDNFKNCTVIGTAMAGLLGANYTVNLPQSNYGLNITFEQLFHVNGTPREAYLPAVGITNKDLQQATDVFIKKAFALIN